MKFHSDLSQLYFLWIWPERNVKVLVLDFRVLILFWIYLNLSLKVELLVCSRTTCSKKLRGLATRSFAAYLSFNQKLPRCHFPNIEIAPFLDFLFGSISIFNFSIPSMSILSLFFFNPRNSAKLCIWIKHGGKRKGRLWLICIASKRLESWRPYNGHAAPCGSALLVSLCFTYQRQRSMSTGKCRRRQGESSVVRGKDLIYMLIGVIFLELTSLFGIVRVAREADTWRRKLLMRIGRIRGLGSCGSQCSHTEESGRWARL